MDGIISLEHKHCLGGTIYIIRKIIATSRDSYVIIFDNAYRSWVTGPYDGYHRHWASCNQAYVWQW